MTCLWPGHLTIFAVWPNFYCVHTKMVQYMSVFENLSFIFSFCNIILYSENIIISSFYLYYVSELQGNLIFLKKNEFEIFNKNWIDNKLHTALCYVVFPIFLVCTCIYNHKYHVSNTYGLRHIILETWVLCIGQGHDLSQKRDTWVLFACNLHNFFFKL